MFRLITGDAGSGKTTRLTESVRADLAAARHILLIVPEQQTVTTERAMAGILPPEACLFFEVTNFTRLSDTVFRMCGGLAGKSCTPAEEQVLMWRTLSELSPLLHTLRDRPDARAVTKMRAVVHELRAARLSPGVLEAAANGVADSALSDKLHDYALISSTYHALLSEYFTDSADRLDRLAEMLYEKKPLADYAVYLDGFSSYTEQQYAVIDALMHCHSLCVTLCTPPHPQKNLCALEALYTRDKLLAMASSAGVPCETERLEGSRRLTDPALAFAAENIYRVDYASLSPYEGKPSDALTMVEAPDPTEACAFVAADILRRVQEQGCRYADFAVICSSAASYEGVLDAALAQNGIPCFFSHSADTLSLACVKMIFCAYAVICGNFRTDDVIAYLKCGAAGIGSDVCDELELYAETWKLDGARWYDTDDWNMSPDGLEAPHSEGRRAYIRDKLDRINTARKTFVPPLHAFAEIAKEPHTVAMHARALTEFLLAIVLPAQLDSRAEALAACADNLAQSYEQLWEVICDALDTLCLLLPDTVMRADEFSDLLKLLLGAVRLGSLPSSLDEVTVGEAALIRSEAVPYVYLLGVNEGEFPAAPQESSAFTEQERISLAALGAPTPDSAEIRAARQLYTFYRALTLTSKSACVIWSRTGAAMEAAAPSDAVVRLRRLLGNSYPVLYLSRENLPDRIRSAGEALARLGQCEGTNTGAALKQALHGDPKGQIAVAALEEPLCNRERTLTPAVAADLYAGDIALTESRLSKYLACPLSYFCTYTLKLDSGREAEFNAAHIGTFLHALLEHFFGEVRARGWNMHALSEEQQRDVLEAVFDEVVSETLPPAEAQRPRTHYLLSALRRHAAAVIACMCEELRHSRFEPAMFEVPIDRRNPDLPSPVAFRAEDGTQIFVYGVIDRVDTLRVGNNVYVRVVDYKTGKMKFSPDKIPEGESLQMPLYLFSLLKTDSAAFREKLGVKEDGRILPAGVLYLSSLADTGASNTPPAGEEAQALAARIPQRSGLVASDPAMLAAMDDTGGDYLPVKFKKDGTPDARSEKYLYTPEMFDRLLEEIGQVLTDIASDMKHGNLAATPMQDGKSAKACAYCPYKPICRNTRKPTETVDGGEETDGEA